MEMSIYDLYRPVSKWVVQGPSEVGVHTKTSWVTQRHPARVNQPIYLLQLSYSERSDVAGQLALPHHLTFSVCFLACILTFLARLILHYQYK